MLFPPMCARSCRPRNLLAVCCTCAGLMFLTACGSEKPNPKAAAAEHDHNHDSEPGHSHNDGHAHDHAEDHAEAEPAHDGEDEHGHDHAAEATGGGIPIPARVRQNLGITFAKVERRHVGSTIRIPGRFEAMPSHQREYHVPLAGRVELLVHQYEHVTTGTPLYRIDSGEWRRMQQELLTVEAEVASTSASLMSAQIMSSGGAAAEEIIRQRIVAADGHIESLAASVKVAEERERQVLRLQQVVGGRMSDVNEARTQLATLRNELSQAREDRAELEQQRLQLRTESGGGSFGTTATLKASMTARRAEYESAKARRDLLRASLLSITGDTTTSLAGSGAAWTPEAVITVRAASEGVVTAVPVTSGAYVDAATQILTTLDTSVLRFRAVALQSDIARLSDTMTGRVLSPGTSDREGVPVKVMLALEADPEERTLDLIADVPASEAWIRSGLSTDLELVLDETEDPELAIPVSAVIQDGLDKVFFRRDPDNPDIATRIEADLGLSNGKWVVIESGAKAGDEVVVQGVYELKLATAATPEKAGHFHADGTFHEGED